MNVLGRVAAGAALGALVTLLLHPTSRPRLFGGLWNWGPSVETSKAEDLLDNLSRLPRPKTVSDASLWMEAGARRILARRPTTSREWESFIHTAQAGAVLEPDNAFWPQMEAVFLMANGKRLAAWASWGKGSRRARWDDGQTSRLEGLSKRLKSAHGDASWVWIPAYGRRTTDSARSIELFARDLVRSTDIKTRTDLELRYATVMNGRLMREGARSIRVGEVALAVVELGSYPPDLMSISSPRKLLIARADLFHALRAQGWTLRADETDRAFRDNDGWFGFPNADEAEASANLTGFGILLANSLGVVAAAIALAGTALVLLGRLLDRDSNTKQPRGPDLLVSAAAAGLLVWYLTKAWLPTTLIVASILSLIVSPSHTRTRATVTLGYLHGFALFITGLGLASAIAVIALTYSTPGVESLPHLGSAKELLDDRQSGTVIATVILSVTIGMSPAFAWVHRFSTTQIIANSSRRLGSALVVFALATLIIGAPLALYADKALGSRLAQLVSNEPVYYYVND